MIFKINKQLIIGELRSFLVAVGAVILIFLLALGLSGGIMPAEMGTAIAILSVAIGTFVAYLANGRKIPVLTLVVILIVAIWWYIVTFLFQPVRVFDKGMEPSYEYGSLVWVNRLNAKSISIKRGDILVVEDPQSGGEFIRRVIGLPGEEVKVLGSLVVINNENYLIEPYVKNVEICFIGDSLESPWARKDSVDTGKYLLLPDNREEPKPEDIDYGYPFFIAIRKSNIIGRVIGNKKQYPILAKLPPPGIEEYRNPQLSVRFYYSSSCAISETDSNTVEIKNKNDDKVLLKIIRLAKNPFRLSTYEWIKRNFRLIEILDYCEEVEGVICPIWSNDKIFDIESRFPINDLTAIYGRFKHSTFFKGSEVGFFIAVNDEIYFVPHLIEYEKQIELLRGIKFEK